jgi:hypothetical protein
VGRIGALVTLACFAATLSAQVDPRTALLERDGWDLIAAGQAHAAADAFRQALSADPRSARLHFGAAAAASLERRDQDARDEAERAIEIDPKLTAARALLGQVQHRMGDTLAAIHTFEALVEAAPDDKGAAATLDRWRRELALYDRMQQAVGSHFTVSFEGPAEESLAEEAIASLDRAYWRVGALLGTYPSEPIPVVLYTAEQFADITRSPTWAAGAYDGTIRVPMRGALENSSELDRVLAHEFTHALIRTLAPRGVPTWLNEGTATALETGEPGPFERRVADMHAGLPLAQLKTSFGRLSGDQAQLAYATSAHAVRRLIEEAGGVALANLLRDLGEGVDFDTAFRHRVQRSFSDFESTLY